MNEEQRKAKYKAANAARGPDYHRAWRGANPEKALLVAAKYRAKRQGAKFDIDADDIRIPDLCPILGVPLRANTRHAPSVDRIRPDGGYVRGNIQVISRKANAMKSDAVPGELVRFADWVGKQYGNVIRAENSFSHHQGPECI